MNADRQLTQTAWLVMALALVLLLGSLAQLGYRYTLPTDGWAVYNTDIEDANWGYHENLVGASSALQQGDEVLAVDGRSVTGTAVNEFTPPPPRWQVGETVSILVRRGLEQLELPVPVVAWTMASVWRYNTTQLPQFASVLGAVLLLAISWFTFLRRPQVPSARALLLFCTANAAASCSGILPDGLSMQFNQLIFYLASFYNYIIFGSVLAPSLLVFALLFPNPKQAIRRHPWLVLLPYAYGLLLLLFLFGGGHGEVGWVSSLAMIVLAIASFVHAAVTQRDAVSRAQLRWALTSFVVGLGLFGLNFPLGFGWVTDQFWVELLRAVSSLSTVVIGAGLAVAVLRYRLYDIDVIIRKTVQYALVTAVLALVYYGAVILLQTVVGRTAGEQSPLVIVLSTLLIAALFNPLRRRVQTFIDRRFFRRKYDAQQVLAQFAQSARDEVEMQELTTALTSAIGETLQPDQLSLWIRPFDN